MSSLSGILSVAVSSLNASEMELQNSANNIANVDTAGYARRTVVLQETTPLNTSPYATPAGVTVTDISSVRDTVLEYRIAAQTSEYNKNSATSDNLSSIETLFSEDTGSVGDSVSSFFTALSDLSTSPSDSTLRSNVLSAADTLATSVSTLYGELKDQQSSVNDSVKSTVEQINELSKEIAAINVQVADLQNLGQDTGTLGDQRSDLINQLSALVNVDIVEGSDGLTLQTANGAQLVVGDHAYTLDAETGSDGLYTISSQGQDVTSEITGGQLGGLLEVRDEDLPDLMGQLDSFAYNFTTAVNSAQSSGYEEDGTEGSTDDVFTELASETGAAAAISVTMTDGSKLAVSSATDGSGTGNLSNFTDIETTKIGSTGVTYGDFYSSIVQDVGTMTSTASALSTSSESTLNQLTDLLSSEQGVSIDEEATDLIRFQQSYQASARVVNVVNELTQTLINMGA